MPSNHSSNSDRTSQPLSGATRSFSLLLCLGALAGVLIWAKLRLVTDIPRSAYADPKEHLVDQPEAISHGQEQSSSPDDQHPANDKLETTTDEGQPSDGHAPSAQPKP